MKKFMKFCLITALVMLGVGCGLSLVIHVIHGGPLSLRDVSDSLREADHSPVTEWGLHVVDEINKVDYELDADILFNDKHTIWNGDVNRQSLADISDVDEIEIEAAGCILDLEISPDDNYYIEAENVRKLQSYVENGTLYVKTLSSTNLWDEIRRRHITLYVPEGAKWDKAEVSLGAGELNLCQLSADKLEIEVGAGQITGTDIRVSDELKIEVGAGAVELYEVQAQELEVEVAVGDLELQGDIASKGDITCSMGNISLTLDGAEETYNYNIQAAMGSVSIGGKEYVGLASDKQIRNGVDRTLTVECSMGGIDVSFAD